MQTVPILLLCSFVVAYALPDGDPASPLQGILTFVESVERRNVAEIGELRQQIKDLKNEVAVLTAKAGETHRSDAVNRRDIMSTADGVAFSAYLDHDRDDIQGDQALVFNQVLSNVGNAYDSATGIFTVPIAGVYYFSFFVGQKGINQLVVGLKKNSINQVDGAAEGIQAGHDAQGGNSAVLALNRGDLIMVNHQSGRVGSHIEGGDQVRVSTFSGFLLYRDSSEMDFVGK